MTVYRWPTYGNARPVVRSDGREFASLADASLATYGHTGGRPQIRKACESGCLAKGYGFEWKESE